MKKNFDVKQITYIAIMTSINVVFTFLSMFLVGFSLILLIGLPFASSIVKLKTQTKYVVIYLVASIILTSLINFQNALFYVMPSLLSGTIFGIFIKKGFHAFYILSLTSLFNIISQTICLVLIYFLYKVNMIEVFSSVFHINQETFFDIYLAFTFMISLVQTMLSYFIIESEIKKFNFKINEKDSIFYPTLITTFLCGIIGFILIFFLPSLSYLFTCFSIISSTYLLYYLFKSNHKILQFSLLITSIITFFIALIVFTNFINVPYHAIFNFFALCFSLNGVILILYMHFFKKEKITIQTFNNYDDIKGEIDG